VVRTHEWSRNPTTTSIFWLQTTITPQPAIQMSNLEGRITLALQAYRRNQFSSLRAAARAYDTLYTTLRRRNYGTTPRSETLSPRLKLTPTEETILVE